MSRDALDEVIAESTAIHQALWQIVVTAAESDPTPVTGLFIQAVNDLIDAHSTRVTLGMHSTIPVEIWVSLYIVTIVALGYAGIQWAGNEHGRAYHFIALVLAFSVVLTLVADLDDPSHGFLRTDQSPMLDLARSLGQ